MGRAMGFAALAMLTVFPLLVSSPPPAPRRVTASPDGWSTAWA